MTFVTSQRNFASGIQVNLGLVSGTFDLVPLRRPTESNRSICPDCEVPTPLNSRLVCPVDPSHTEDQSRIVKARQVGKMLVPLTAEDLESVKETDMPAGVLSLSACPSEDLRTHTRMGEGQYRLRLPKKGGNSDVYAILRHLAGFSAVSLYGVMKINDRTRPTPFVLQVWKRQLVLQAILRPEEIADVDEVDATCAPELKEMATEFVQRLVAPLDVDSLTDNRAAAMRALVAAKEGYEPVVPTTPRANSVVSLEEALAAALAKVA